MSIDQTTLDSIALPDELRTVVGDFSFIDGVPSLDSVSSLYDVLDLLRGVEAFLVAMPGAALSAMRNGVRGIGMTSTATVGITDPRANSTSLYLTPNTDTTYAHAFLDLHADGPVVIEAPPKSLCVVDDFWFRYVTDMGIAGEDKGAGGKYLIVPPGHDEPLPDGYLVRPTPTFTNWAVFRALEGVPAIKTIKIYPLAKAADPPPTRFVDITDTPHNTVHANDFTFYEEVDAIVQEEPLDSLDPERRGILAAIGIVKGRPFAPDDRLRGILAKAAPLGAAIARALVYQPRDPDSYYYEGSSWKQAFVGGSYEFLRDGARLLDARALFHYFATVITPAMAAASVGAGSQYAYTAEDSDGGWLDGAKDYRLHLPPGVPAKNFWSVCVYDTQTRSLLRTDNPYPSVSSLDPKTVTNPDGSAEVYFGPNPPSDGSANWIQTVPGKGWFVMLRLYGPLESWFDKSWRPGEIEPVAGKRS
ncbi:DUF1254 domain-containing protein [Hamadaea sp. NPDC051192]|uniref:DUF1254 domain-containing protein n=1 Tax=Hamadaea sp. NPDC051192 TaxID=3154940 RepID=UPI003448F895